MKVIRMTLKNWRNFNEVDFPLHDRTYLIGPNASGKSNLLDVLRFLRDIAKPEGGGLQKAIRDRGGLSKLRCLQARKETEVRIAIELTEETKEGMDLWNYAIAFKSEGKGLQRPVLLEEKVTKNRRVLLDRPNEQDLSDRERLTQTALEQINANQAFRELANFLQGATYLHLVPQLLKYGERIGGSLLEEDPFGQGFLERVCKTPKKTRDSRLNKIQAVLQTAVPRFKELLFETDPNNGKPHIKARYDHWRPKGAWQREEEFSDGTLRLIGLLWSLLDGDSLLLLEEPELSLNEAIVQRIPQMIDSILKRAKNPKRQVLISTHSAAILSNPIDERGVLLLEPEREGTTVRSPSEEEKTALRAGLTVSEVILPKTRPQTTKGKGLWDE
ncbi:MAG: AAA family ATPase [Magnetococcales bacterium]|nr:AAA family ATPase [Magnetococcales bacterium]